MRRVNSAGGGFVLGLTGASGSGQSTAARAMARPGVVVLSLDEAGHRLLERRHIRAEIARRLGDPSLAGLSGTDLRRRLRSVAFGNRAVMEGIEAALHPVMRRWASFCSHIIKKDNRMAVIEGSLLFELGGSEAADQVAVTACDEADCVRRMMSRDGMDERAARLRLAMQLPLTERLQRADWVILNSEGTSVASVDNQARAILDHIGLSR